MTDDPKQAEVERVAKAIKAARYVCGPDGVYRSNTDEELANAAIAAVRETGEPRPNRQDLLDMYQGARIVAATAEGERDQAYLENAVMAKELQAAQDKANKWAEEAASLGTRLFKAEMEHAAAVKRADHAELSLQRACENSNHWFDERARIVAERDEWKRRAEEAEKTSAEIQDYAVRLGKTGARDLDYAQSAIATLMQERDAAREEAGRLKALLSIANHGIEQQGKREIALRDALECFADACEHAPPDTLRSELLDCCTIAREALAAGGKDKT